MTSTLESDLRALGYDCAVESHDGLAVLVLPRDTPDPMVVALRGDALRLAASHGFTHVALEIAGGLGADADLSVD